MRLPFRAKEDRIALTLRPFKEWLEPFNARPDVNYPLGGLLEIQPA